MIEYKQDVSLDVQKAWDLYVDSTLGKRRPMDERERFAAMLQNANLTITAWDGDLLVGISRCITDWVWTTYLADLAVRLSYQKSGIGKELMRRTQAAAPKAKLLLLAAPEAKDYYGHVGFAHMPSAWWLLPGERITS
jgi:GNAT superfamily N-acetyltransferase